MPEALSVAVVALRLLGGSDGRIALGELALEALDTAGGVHELALTRVEGVACAADFQQDVALVRGAGLKSRTAGALDVGLDVVRVNSLLRHWISIRWEVGLPCGSPRIWLTVRLQRLDSRHIDVPVALPWRPALQRSGAFPILSRSVPVRNGSYRPTSTSELQASRLRLRLSEALKSRLRRPCGCA
jgi:hypothetical protein